MKKEEKFKLLDAVIVATEMTEKEVEVYFQSRKGIVQSIFPIAYKRENNFEILPYLDYARKKEVWGFEIMPGVILAKRCDTVDGVKADEWIISKNFAEKCTMAGKQGKLPSKELLKQNWSIELITNIRKMDEFLCEYDVNAEQRSSEKLWFTGVLWCSDVSRGSNPYYFIMENGTARCSVEPKYSIGNRLVVSF